MGSLQSAHVRNLKTCRLKMTLLPQLVESNGKEEGVRRESCSFCFMWLINRRSDFFFLIFYNKTKTSQVRETSSGERDVRKMSSSRKWEWLKAESYAICVPTFFSWNLLMWSYLPECILIGEQEKFKKSSILYTNLKTKAHIFWWKNNYLIWLLSCLYFCSLTNLIAVIGFHTFEMSCLEEISKLSLILK